ncbi:hypothetical protein [Janthinobacterium sp. HLX7-2]|uniref:hypothetical protein n=1 Tax=Janthinobacterium sp. HLX7-2 TaxID=1259331 RepID=UPI003F2040F2
MKQVLPHIQIGLHNDEHVIVVVGDYELADFIEDHLGDDCDLPYDYRTTAERLGGEIVTLHFPESALLQEIEGGLTKLSSDEVEGIYRLTTNREHDSHRPEAAIGRVKICGQVCSLLVLSVLVSNRLARGHLVVFMAKV